MKLLQEERNLHIATHFKRGQRGESYANRVFEISVLFKDSDFEHPHFFKWQKYIYFLKCQANKLFKICTINFQIFLKFFDIKVIRLEILRIKLALIYLNANLTLEDHICYKKFNFLYYLMFILLLFKNNSWLFYCEGERCIAIKKRTHLKFMTNSCLNTGGKVHVILHYFNEFSN